jgi:hypothetical protein
MSTEYIISADRLELTRTAGGEKLDNGRGINYLTCSAAGEIPHTVERLASDVENDIEAWIDENPGQSPMAHDVHWQITVSVDADAS